MEFLVQYLGELYNRILELRNQYVYYDNKPYNGSQTM